MPIGRGRQALKETIKEAADKAGTVVMTALTLAAAALIVALVALATVLRMRPRHAG